MRKLLCALLVALSFGSVQAANFALPTERSADWSYVGINGTGFTSGILTNFTQWCDISQSIPGTNIVADKTGVTNSIDAFAAAASLCPTGRYIYLPKGTYLLTNSSISTFQICGPSLNGMIEWRGDGIGSTGTVVKIRGSVQLTAKYSPSNYRTNSIYWPSGTDPVLPKGATNCSVLLSPTPNTTHLIVGNYAIFDQSTDGDPNDPSTTNHVRINDALVMTRGNEGDWGGTAGNMSSQGTYRNNMQLVKITSITAATNITWWPPLATALTNSLGPRLWYWDNGLPPHHFGMRDIYFDLFNNGTSPIFQFSHASDFWFHNCQFGGWTNIMMDLLSANANYQIQHCYFHDSPGLTPNQGYAILPEVACEMGLIQDNIFEGIRTPIVQQGGRYNVFYYNLMNNFTNASGNPTLQKTPSTHACWPAMNLWEGNIGGRFGGDNTHGNSGLNVFFRNWMQGYDSRLTNYNYAFSLSRLDRFYSAVDNIVSHPYYAAGAHGALYEALAPTSGNTDVRNGGGTPAGWDIGYTSDGAIDFTDVSGYFYQRDTNLWSTNISISYGRLIRQGNYDYITASVHNEPEYGTQTYDTSWTGYGRPDWWTNWGTATANYPAFGSDLSSKTNTIPAVDRYTKILAGDYSFSGTVGGGGGSAPATPTGLAAFGGVGTVSVSWNSSATATGYTLQRSPDNSTWTTVYSSAGIAYTDSNLAAGTYYYQVLASNASGNSAYSSSVNVLVTTPHITVKGNGTGKGKHLFK